MTSVTLSPLPSPIHAPPAPYWVAEAPPRPNRPNPWTARRPEAPLVHKARSALQSPLFPPPERSEEGTGGTYFLRDEQGRPFAVFKPIDEEPGAENDGKAVLTRPLLSPGGGGLRELAAYALDQILPEHARAGVPETHLLSKVSHQAFHGGRPPPPPPPPSFSFFPQAHEPSRQAPFSDSFPLQEERRLSRPPLYLLRMCTGSASWTCAFSTSIEMLRTCSSDTRAPL